MRLQSMFRGILMASMVFVAACGDEHDHDESQREEAYEHTKEDLLWMWQRLLPVTER